MSNVKCQGCLALKADLTRLESYYKDYKRNLISEMRACAEGKLKDSALGDAHII